MNCRGLIDERLKDLFNTSIIFVFEGHEPGQRLVLIHFSHRKFLIYQELWRRSMQRTTKRPSAGAQIAVIWLMLFFGYNCFGRWTVPRSIELRWTRKSLHSCLCEGVLSENQGGGKASLNLQSRVSNV